MHQEAGEAGDFVRMAEFLKATSPHAIMVDATASEAVSDFYPAWLSSAFLLSNTPPVDAC